MEQDGFRLVVDLGVCGHAAPVPEDSRRYLSCARQAALQAAEAGAHRLLVTHLTSRSAASAARAAAREVYDGGLDVATAGLALDIP